MNAKKSDKGANALLGDLESIRTLLTEEERAAQGEAETTNPQEVETPQPSVEAEKPGEDDVPVLDDVVDAAEGATDVDELALNETAEAPKLEPAPDLEQMPDVEQTSDPEQAPETNQIPATEAEEPPIGLDDDMFNRLLGDDWRQAAAVLLDEARGSIEAHSQQWTPQDTDELNEALQVRIDETLHRWLRRTVQERIDDLRAELLTAISDQLEATVKQRFNDALPGEGAHGE
jgi:hypothetical protein